MDPLWTIHHMLEKIYPYYNFVTKIGLTAFKTGADLGRGGGWGCGRPFSQGFDPLPTQSVPPLILFQKSSFGRPTLKLF